MALFRPKQPAEPSPAPPGTANTPSAPTPAMFAPPGAAAPTELMAPPTAPPAGTALSAPAGLPGMAGPNVSVAPVVAQPSAATVNHAAAPDAPMSAGSLDGLVKQFESSNEQKTAAAAAMSAHDDSIAENAPVVQVVNMLVAQAMRDRTSDVHIEAIDERVRVRFRIDGTLVEEFSLPIAIHLALVSRLKIMAGMNIVERRRPQDGQFSTTIDGKPVDVRVASVTTVFGEKVVLRLLDKSRSLIGLSQLGFPRDTYEDFSAMVHSPFGMVLCAGPTGAGKTTTLYATLLEINSTGKNIVTIEDPVEYIFPGINQIQTNDGAGLTLRHRTAGHAAPGPRRDPRR